jgi:hypothetical protein
MEATEIIQLLDKDFKITLHKFDAGSLQRYLVRYRINMVERSMQSLVYAYTIETLIKAITDKVYKSTFNKSMKVGLTFNTAQYMLIHSLFSTCPPASNLMPLEYKITEHIRKHSIL